MVYFSKNIIAYLIVLGCVAFMGLLQSCKEEGNDEPTLGIAQQTVFMYLPWSDNLHDALEAGEKNFESSIVKNRGLDGRRFIVFLSRDAATSFLINVTYKNGKCVKDTVKRYSFTQTNYTTEEGLSTILTDMKKAAPAQDYAMIIGCNGTGWLPKGVNPLSAEFTTNATGYSNCKKSFGHESKTSYMTDISTLVAALKAASIKMKYILFDDCYMSNIEVAYDLRDVTQYYIATCTEMQEEGLPYQEVGYYLLHNDFEKLCNWFYAYYNNSSLPYCNIAVTDCSQLETMAAIVRQINMSYPNEIERLGTLQKLDGYYPTVFYDFGDYINKICSNNQLKENFNSQLEKLVVYKKYTSQFYSVLYNEFTAYDISAYSGLTTSEPTVNSVVKPYVSTTNWYKATH